MYVFTDGAWNPECVFNIRKSFLPFEPHGRYRRRRNLNLNICTPLVFQFAVPTAGQDWLCEFLVVEDINIYNINEYKATRHFRKKKKKKNVT